MGSFEANKIRARAGVFSARSDKTGKPSSGSWFVLRKPRTTTVTTKGKFSSRVSFVLDEL